MQEPITASGCRTWTSLSMEEEEEEEKRKEKKKAEVEEEEEEEGGVTGLMLQPHWRAT